MPSCCLASFALFIYQKNRIVAMGTHKVSDRTRLNMEHTAILKTLQVGTWLSPEFIQADSFRCF